MDADVIIFYGPPHCGKSLYYTQHLKETHDRLCPSIELQRQPDLTLRQLILTQIIAPLKQGKKIVIDDENGSFTKRDSYICLVKKKLPDCTVVCLSFSPQHGQPQLLWSREFLLASGVVNNADTSRCCHLETASIIQKWMNDKSTLDPPRMTEGYEAIKEIKTQFQVQVHYKFEWPVLLVQWEALVRGPGLDRLTVVPGAADTVTVWSQQHPTGRVVVLVDHAAFDTGTLCDRDMAIQTALKSLTKTVTTVGVYALHVHDVSRSGAFSTPPAPGLVAFLQRLLDLQLTHKASVYAYHTPAHMHMAEQAGIKHIKASRLFNRPALAKGSHAFTTVPIPPLLKHLRLVPEEVETTTATASTTVEPSLPLSDASLPASSYYADSVAPYIRQRDMGCGRMLYVSAQNRTVFEKYAALCATRATPVSVDDAPQTAADPSYTSQQAADEAVAAPRLTIKRQDSVQRDLPRWMKPKEDTKRDYKPKLKKLTSRTTYIMTSEELLATARHILAEGLETSENEDTVIQPQPTSKQKPCDKIMADTVTIHTPTKIDKTVSICNIEPPRVKNNDLNSHNDSYDTKPIVPPGRIGVTQDTFKYSNILDDLFDDEEYGMPRRPAPSTQRRGKGRQSHMDEYLSPSKRKRASEKLESTYHTAAKISTPTKASTSSHTPTKQVKLERYASTRLDGSVPHRPGTTIKMEDLLTTRTDTINITTNPITSDNFSSRGDYSRISTDRTRTKPIKSEDFVFTRADIRNSPASHTATKPIKSENFVSTTGRGNVWNNPASHNPTNKIKSENFVSTRADARNSPASRTATKAKNFFSIGEDTSSTSFTTQPIKSEYFVADTASVEVQDNSIVLVDTQEDSLEVSDSMSQEQDSILVYDSEEDVEPRGANHRNNTTAFTNLKQRGRYSVTTVPETTESARKSYY